jgi:hypothetical protein
MVNNTRALGCVLTSAALVLMAASCEFTSPPSKHRILRELWLFSRVTEPIEFKIQFDDVQRDPDTTTFAFYTMAATRDTAAWNEAFSTWKKTRALLSSVLGQLGYGTGPFTWNYGQREQSALSHFQRDLGIPVTGQLDSLTIWHLMTAQDALNTADIVLPGLQVDRFGQWFKASGTWEAITNELGYPVNTVNIECNGITGKCDVTTVEFINEALKQVGQIRTQSLRVVHWDKDMLVAKSGDEADITLTINVPAQDVTWTQEKSGVTTSMRSYEDLRRRAQWQFRSALPSNVWTGAAKPDTGHAQRMTMKLVDGMKLSPPFDGGDLKELHVTLFKDKEKYLALRNKNMIPPPGP